MKPKGYGIKKQAQTEPPFDIDDTLVDDTVALVDDVSALVGGNTVTMPEIKLQAKAPAVKASIPIRR